MLVDEKFGNLLEWEIITKHCLVVEVFQLFVHQLPAFFFLFINADHRDNEFSPVVRKRMLLKAQRAPASNIFG